MSGNPNLQPVRKRKKHAPDRQQPEWLFPQDSENPALKPRQDLTAQQKLEKQRSIDFLNRRSVGAPAKPAPPVQLLNLIGVFLAEYGFVSTGRVFSTERQGRIKLDGWKNDTNGKLENGMPTLSKIYKDWRKEWEERRQLEMTSSDDEDDAATKREKMLGRKGKIEKQQQKAQSDNTSSSGSDSSGKSDIEMKDAAPVRKTTMKKASSSSSSSDSDADDEQEAPTAKASPQKPKTNKLKRKASASSTSSSGSDSSSSENIAPKAKKSKNNVEVTSLKGAISPVNRTSRVAGKLEEPSSQSSSESTSTSDSGSSKVSPPKKTPLPASSSSESSSDSDSNLSSKSDNKNKIVVSSDTSATLSDRPKKTSTGSSDTGNSASNAVMSYKGNSTVSKRKLPSPLPPSSAAPKSRRVNEPFQRISKDVKVIEKLASNAYVPYDYAQKAHEDLIVTKGKSFQKEKNKKKRGSYKGGYIDVEGKKGIKFED